MRAQGQTAEEMRAESARLDSWKEIAAFFGRDVRTVRRWRAERNLPVHRVHAGERSPVFAYVGELQEWLHLAAAEVVEERAEEPGTDRLEATQGNNPRPEAAVGEVSGEPAGPALGAAGPQAEAVRRQAEGSERTELRGRGRRWVGPLLALMVALLLAGVVGYVRHRQTQRAEVAASHAPRPEAQELYLRGRFFWNQRTEESLTEAVDLFTQAIVHDPGYAAAYAGLADSYLLLRQYGKMPDAEAYPRALAAARQAVALDDSSPEAHRSLAFILSYWVWDWPAADREFRRSIVLRPGESQTHHWYATALFAYGHGREALVEIDTARRLEPQSLSVLADRGLILGELDLPLAIDELERVSSMDPKFVSAHTYLTFEYLRRRDYAHFVQESLQAAQLSNKPELIAIFQRAEANRARDGGQAMLRALTPELGRQARDGKIASSAAAAVANEAGDLPAALRLLTLSCQKREATCLGLGTNPEFASLRAEPEFQRLLATRFDPQPQRE